MRETIGILLLAVAPGFAQTHTERSLPAFFITNRGQTDPSVRFLIQTPGLQAGFTQTAAMFQVGVMALRVQFEGANPGTRIEGDDLLPTRASFLIGNHSEDWRTDLPSYRKITYREIYPGIDMTYGGAGELIKSEFVVAPGADPSRIRLKYSGGGISIDANGDLLLRSGRAEVREQAPLIYQDSKNGPVPVQGAYRLIDANTVAFDIASYDVSRPLVIDPVLSYATYWGGSGMSAVTGVKVDASGNLYITGWTEALDMNIFGAYQAANRGGVDAFVAKLNPTGTVLLYATYIGGSSDDRAYGIAVDASGQAYVAGSTSSSNFPVVAAARASLTGGRDAFVLKLNAAGNLPVYSTYLGGTNSDNGYAIAVDSSGNAYVAGDTVSTDFPVLNAARATSGGMTDAFVTKLSSAGALVYSTYLGGSADDHAGGIAVDASGNAYVAGGTKSFNFPLASPLQATLGGAQNAFVTKLNGSQIVYSTYLGGNSAAQEQGNAIAVDSSGNAYLAGVTGSTNFPVTSGAFQTMYNGAQDAFVSKINSAGSALVYSTYLGGTSFDWASALAVDSAGSAYVAGYTSSAGLPVVSAVQSVFNGFYDAFVARLNAQGNALSFSTFYGGTGADSVNALAVDANGNMFAGGQTSSLDLALAVPIVSANRGGSVGWVARIGVTPPPAQVPSAVSVTPSTGSGNTVTFTATFSDPAGAAALTSAALLLNTTASPDYGCSVSYTPSQSLFYLANDVASSGSGSVVPGGGSAQNDQCTLVGASSSAVLSGTTLTLTVSLIFQPGFPGLKTVYLSAADASSNTGWVSRGSWTVTIPPPQPTADAASPNNSMGSSQTFTFTFSDTQNALNLTGMAMLFSTSLSNVNACSLAYDRIAGKLSLAWDSGAGSDSKPITSATLLQNSQCIAGASSVTLTGLSNIVSVAITFKGPFSGTKNIYMYGSENGVYTTGWVQRGTYTVAAGGLPVANSVVPASGSGPSQRFSFTVSDAGGSGFLTGLAVLISTSLSQTNACYVVYDRTVNRISLSYDNPLNGASPVVPGSTTVVSNSQCTLKGINSTVVIGTTSMVVTLDITFSANFFGAKNAYLYGAEPGINSGWTLVGGWTVTGGAPTADSVSPSAGNGYSPSFTFIVSDSSAATNITTVGMLITAGSPANIANACYLIYDRVAGTIGLYGDSGSTLSTKGIGSSATLQNTQCAVGYTAANISGNSVIFTLNLTFRSYLGSKTVYLQANEPNAGSGWVARGTWTLP